MDFETEDECKILIIHEDRVIKARRDMPDEKLLQKAGDFFKALSDPARIKIVNALSSTEMCVCDLTAVLNMNQPAVSQHLRTLKQAGIVTFRKDGKVVYYSLHDEETKSIHEKVMRHINAEKE
ncbi:metalloregulator ArsR/SmtB family transcription factor [Treponema zuelzerae]|uniref:Metalloregulator ArsR/SmtB family transcription factor n=1 Tax=Teretinema zuelzerae TaxID=156 RepID=A0AAE3JJ76_9SPIR|nr:metalloregulator ArsR/SmtB family transcription factor [Teretinema zuelzerae]MCD1655198.1 metalloregulator ArsR/SmtB family transcription factor [Teretinema zuelzerae]